MNTCEPVFGVAAVALHPRKCQRGHVVDRPAHRRDGGVTAAQRPVRGDTDDPGGVRVSPICTHAHVHVICPAEGSYPARVCGAAISGVPASITATVPTAGPANVVSRVSVVRLVHFHPQHAALLCVAEDLIDAETDGLGVRVLLQMRR